jgi:hypothetical protein
MPHSEWSSVGSYPDRVAAAVVLGLLAANDVPGRISSDETIPGLTTFVSVDVPTELLPRARSIMQSARVPDNELTYLATHELPQGPTED